jgi:chorismate mutase
MSASVRAFRGATTVERDEPDHITERVQELVRTVLDDNGLVTDDLISIMFTATADISSMFPATAARSMGLDDVPLFGAQELDVQGALPRCVRVMVHAESKLARNDVRHVYLHDARRLRVDLVK